MLPVPLNSSKMTSSIREPVSTRKEELLIPKEDLQRVFILRRVLNPLSPVEAMELLISRLEKVRNNAEFLANMNQL